ncbi:MAG: hypothetical protein ChlgKO_02940 [Chlamydiales bacterium]
MFTASLKERHALSNRTFHIVLEAPGVSYTPGAVIAIYPENPKERVDAILEIMGDESLREHFTKEVDLSSVPEGITRAEELPQLPPLRHRYYSIASSAEVIPGEIHLTIATFTTQQNGREVAGLCSNFLCKEMNLGTKLTCFIPDKKKFSAPQSSNTPAIMISSGAGIAPFRGFMQERSQASTKNWLIHGGRTEKDDYYYREEWERLIESGHLKVTTAFSRDQEEKIYVQDRMKKEREELLKWIDEGAIIYICGNSKEMVKDVTATLADILGGKEYVDALRVSGRLFP